MQDALNEQQVARHGVVVELRVAGALEEFDLLRLRLLEHFLHLYELGLLSEPFRVAGGVLRVAVVAERPAGLMSIMWRTSRFHLRQNV